MKSYALVLHHVDDNGVPRYPMPIVSMHHSFVYGLEEFTTLSQLKYRDL